MKARLWDIAALVVVIAVVIAKADVVAVAVIAVIAKADVVAVVKFLAPVLKGSGRRGSGYSEGHSPTANPSCTPTRYQRRKSVEP